MTTSSVARSYTTPWGATEEHGRKAGRWYLELGFGKLDGPAHPIFVNLDEAQDWVTQRIG